MSTSTSDPLNRPRGGNGAFVRSPDTAERDAAAAQLRVEGRTYQQIADELKLSDKGHAHQCVSRALLAIVREPAEQLRTLELARLDEAMIVVREIMHTRHHAHSGGRLVTYVDEQDKHVVLEDNAPRLAAVGKLMDIMNRRAKLLGLDAVVKVHMLTLEEVQAEIARLEGEVSELPEEGE